MIIDPNEQNKKDAYFFAISLMIPRPIAFVTSSSSDGVINAAPFSYFNGISTKPPQFTISIAKKKGKSKDSARNILDQKEFCVNFVSEEMVEGVTISAGDFDSDQSEMDYNGFDLIESEKIKIPRIAQSPASMECKLIRCIDDLGAGDFNLIVGEVLLYHVNDDLIDSDTGYVKAKESNIVGRLGGADFVTLGRTITVPRKHHSEYEKTKSIE